MSIQAVPKPSPSHIFQADPLPSQGRRAPLLFGTKIAQKKTHRPRAVRGGPPDGGVIMTWLGIILLTTAVGYVVWAVVSARKQREAEKDEPSFSKIIEECRKLNSRNFHPNI